MLLPTFGFEEQSCSENFTASLGMGGMLSFLQGKFLGVDLLGPMVNLTYHMTTFNYHMTTPKGLF